MNAIPLQHVKVSDEKDPRDGKPLIKINVPPSQVLIMRASDNSDFKAWYTSIFYAAMNAHGKRKIDDFSKAINKLESESSKNDKSEITSYFYNVDSLLKGEETRSIVLQKLIHHQPQYKYLVVLDKNIQSYNSMIQFEKYAEAFLFLQANKKMLLNFSLSEAEEAKTGEDEKKDETAIMREQMENQYLEDDVRELMKGIINEEFTTKINAIIEQGQKEGPVLTLSQGKGIGLFADIWTNIQAKIKSGYDEIRSAHGDSETEMN